MRGTTNRGRENKQIFDESIKSRFPPDRQDREEEMKGLRGRQTRVWYPGVPDRPQKTKETCVRDLHEWVSKDTTVVGEPGSTSGLGKGRGILCPSSNCFGTGRVR